MSMVFSNEKNTLKQKSVYMCGFSVRIRYFDDKNANKKLNFMLKSYVNLPKLNFLIQIV